MKRLLILLPLAGAALCCLSTAHAEGFNVCAVPDVRATLVADMNILWRQNNKPLLTVAVSNVSTVIYDPQGGTYACHFTAYFRDGSSRTGTLAETDGRAPLWVPDNQ